MRNVAAEAENGAASAGDVLSGGLEPLLDRLHLAGIAVSPRERLDAVTLYTILRLASRAGAGEQRFGEQLANSLSALLGKSEAQRWTIEQAVRGMASGLPQPLPDIPDPHPPVDPPERPSQERRWLWYGAALVCFLLLIAGRSYFPGGPVIGPDSLPAIGSERENVGVGEADRSAQRTASPDRFAALTSEEIKAAAETIVRAVDGKRNATLWQLASRVARADDTVHGPLETYKRLQRYSGLSSTEMIDLASAPIMRRVLLAWLAIDVPGRGSDPSEVGKIVDATVSALASGEVAGDRVPGPASAAYVMPWPLFLALVSAPLAWTVIWLLGYRNRKRRHNEDVLSRGTGRLEPRVAGADLERKPLDDQRRKLRRASQQLDGRSTQETRTLDIEASIDATLGRGGIFTPHYSARKITPEYLALILTHGPDDQEADRLTYVTEVLGGSTGVSTGTRRDSKLERRYLEHDANRTFVDRDERGVSLAALAATHDRHHLMVLGTGDGLLDPVTNGPKPWAQALRHWSVRALATPVPPTEWGMREARLSQLMGGPIFHTTAESLAAMAAYLRERAEAGESPVDYATSVRRRWRFDPQRYMLELPLDEATEWRRLRQDLIPYLDARGDDRGMVWLRALAVYPALRWDLTCYLGLRLKARCPAGKIMPLYDEHLATCLSVLPWFEAGHMPRWVRRRLISELTDEQRHDVLRAIGELLIAPPAVDTKGEQLVRLPVSVSGTAAGEVPSRRGGREDTRTPFDDLAANDRELLELMDNAPTGVIHGTRRSLWERLMTPGARFERGEYLAMLLLFAYAAAALLLVPKPWGLPAATGGWWPSAILVTGLAGLPLAARLLARALREEGDR